MSLAHKEAHCGYCTETVGIPTNAGHLLHVKRTNQLPLVFVHHLVVAHVLGQAGVLAVHFKLQSISRKGIRQSRGLQQAVASSEAVSRVQVVRKLLACVCNAVPHMLTSFRDSLRLYGGKFHRQPCPAGHPAHLVLFGVPTGGHHSLEGHGGLPIW